MFKAKVNYEDQALSLTPAALTLSGRWLSEFSIDGQMLVGIVDLNQVGAAVEGIWQLKLAALHPIRIRGLIVDSRLVATQWRPHRHGLGSGLFDLVYDGNSGELKGTATWYDERNVAGTRFGCRWSRAGTKKS